MIPGPYQALRIILQWVLPKDMAGIFHLEAERNVWKNVLRSFWPPGKCGSFVRNVLYSHRLWAAGHGPVVTQKDDALHQE